MRKIRMKKTSRLVCAIRSSPPGGATTALCIADRVSALKLGIGMTEAGVNQLKEAIEHQHGGAASLVQSVHRRAA